MNKQNAFRRGFTLIELMIVIVILGILMGTILPRLTGAQARARDTARKADLGNISQALEVYFSDNGQYPTGAGCLRETGETKPAAQTRGDANATADALGDYLKGGTIIYPGSAAQSSVGCIGAYYYSPLAKSGVPNAAYVLVSDVETWQEANVNASTLKFVGDIVNLAYDAVANLTGSDKVSQELNPATDSAYAVIP